MWVKLSPRWQVRQTAAHREMLPFHLLFTRSIITLHFKHTQSAAATLLPTRAPPGGSLLRGGCVQVCVQMRKYFLETGCVCIFVCMCVSLDLHFCAYFFVLACESVSASDLNGSLHFMCVGPTAAS